MAATEVTTVTLTIDGRELTVEKGTPLVLAAAHAGVEIPVFCYEPRLGGPIGACRMCLVEIEGMPRLQAACTLTATDGWVVRSDSAKAADGQQAVLEFILLNHPLDCPVCDKGGECPLQDLTMRYGPGNTRFHLNKRTYEKPIAISPLIALDRERCILCYRCTRFSQDVAEDEQLITRERGADSVIATFEGRPYLGAFSGNVIELCPVGALTSTEYRFKARPWEINNVPTVCGRCSTGCNTWATVREGKVQRMLSRNHPAVDEGWLCDKGRFTHAHLDHPDRYAGYLLRGPRGLEPATPEAIAETVALRLRHFASLYGPDSIAVLASGEQTNEEGAAWAELVRAAGGGALVSNGDAAASAWELIAPVSARIADLDEADVIVVAGDRDVLDAGGVVDLRVRKALRRGARLVLASVGGTRLDRSANEHITTPAGKPLSDPDAIVAALSDAASPVLIVTDPVDLREVAQVADRAGLAGKPGGVLPLPIGPNELGLRAVGFTDDPAAVLARDLKLIIVLGDADPIAAWANGTAWNAKLQAAESVICSSLFPTASALWAHAVIPATDVLEKEGTFVNSEGRVQRLRPALAPPVGVAPELALLAAAAGHLGAAVDAAPHRMFKALTATAAFAGLSWEGVGARTTEPARTTPPVPALPSPAASAAVPSGLAAIATRSLFAGAAVERTERLAFQRPGEVVMNIADARAAGLGPGDRLTVTHAGGSTSGALRVSRTLARGAVRFEWSGGPVAGACTVERA